MQEKLEPIKLAVGPYQVRPLTLDYEKEDAFEDYIEDQVILQPVQERIMDIEELELDDEVMTEEYVKNDEVGHGMVIDGVVLQSEPDDQDD